MKIALVNDLAMAVEAMRRVLTLNGEHQILWTAANGEEAVRGCQRELPDLVLMDLDMPGVNGIVATRQIMAATPCPIVIVTASANDNPAKVFEAMGAGALDAVNLPGLGAFGSAQTTAPLLAKVETIRRLVSPHPWKKPDKRRPDETTRVLSRQEQVVCVGCSAGGPAALAKLLTGLPADFPAAVVIVQHVDAQFSTGLANWLASHSKLPVRLVEENDRPSAGAVLLAGRDHHLVFASPHRLGYTRAAADSAYRPSVDVLFKSAAEHCRGIAVGVLLTGMGRDGAEGLLALRHKGHLTIAQDEQSSAVFGMPKAAIQIKAATEILALDKIAPRLVNVFAQRPKL